MNSNPIIRENNNEFRFKYVTEEFRLSEYVGDTVIFGNSDGGACLNFIVCCKNISKT